MRLSHRLVQMLCLLATLMGVAPNVLGGDGKTRIVIVSSYHREYLWSQDTHAGVTQALLDFGYLDNADQVEAFTENDFIESSRAIITKLWMDTKRKGSRDEIKLTVATVVQRITAADPHLILLGDDNAANYIGNQYIDTPVPMVFWGINGNPLKYGLVDSVDRPGHNITGVYQSGYVREGLLMLKRLVGNIDRIAVLADDSPSGRSNAKEIERLVRNGDVPVQHVDMIVTNVYSEWKARTLAAKPHVDAFFVLNHNTLKDDSGNYVEPFEAAAWYLANIDLPDISHERQFVLEGVLCAVDDSGHKQGYEAIRIADRILRGGEDPGEIPVYAPERGRFVVNTRRAEMLGLGSVVANMPLVEERVDTALALIERTKRRSGTSQ